MTHLNTARIHLRKAKVLGVDPCTLKDIMLLGVLKHLFGALKALRSLKNSQNTHFYPLAPNCSAPWWPNPNTVWLFRVAWPKLPSLRVPSKSSNVKGNLEWNLRACVTCAFANHLSKERGPTLLVGWKSCNVIWVQFLVAFLYYMENSRKYPQSGCTYTMIAYTCSGQKSVGHA